MVLESHRLMILSDFNNHALATKDQAAEDSMVSMIIMGLYQAISGPTYQARHIFILIRYLVI